MCRFHSQNSLSGRRDERGYCRRRRAARRLGRPLPDSPGGHHDEKNHRRRGQRVEDPPRPIARGPKIQQGHEQHDQPTKTEEQHAHDFAFQPLDSAEVRREAFQRLEHEEEVPFRLDSRRRRAEGIGLLPQFPGEQGGQGRKDRQRQVPADHVAKEEMGDEGHAGDAVLAAPPQGRLPRHAHPVALHEEQVQSDQRHGRQRQDHHVQGVEAGERVAADVFAAPGQQEQGLSRHGDRFDDRRAHLRGEEGELIPRQQVAAESEGQENPQQGDAGEPRQFSRPPIRPHDVRRQQVQKEHSDQQVGAPGVNRAKEPAEVNFRHNRPHALEGVVGRGLVKQRQEDAGDDLDGEKEQGHSAEEVEDRHSVDRNSLVGGQGRDVQSQAVVQEIQKELRPAGFPFRLLRRFGRQ